MSTKLRELARFFKQTPSHSKSLIVLILNMLCPCGPHSNLSRIELLRYSFDSADRRTRRIDFQGDRTTWTYDAAGQLTDEWQTGPTSLKATFLYDAAGNRTSQRRNGDVTQYRYNTANQALTAITLMGRTSYSYDAAGNQTAIKDSSGNIVTTIWDAESRQQAVEEPSGARTTFTYTCDHWRVSRDDGFTDVRYQWDKNNLLAETDTFGTVQVQYTNEPEEFGNLVSQRQPTETVYYHFDAQGSTVALTDPAAAISDRYLYDAWGNSISTTGTTTNPYLWIGQQGYRYDEALQRHTLRRREYDAQLGRFFSQDPKGLEAGDPNFYRYVSNNPTNSSDPSGLQEQAACPTGLADTHAVSGGKEQPHFRYRISCGYTRDDPTYRYRAYGGDPRTGGYRYAIRYVIGRQTEVASEGRKAECVERKGKYLPTSVVRRICAVSNERQQVLKETDWDQFFSVGASTCDSYIPPKPKQDPALHLWNTPSPTCPAPQPQQSTRECKYKYVEEKLEPSMITTFLFGDQPQTIRVYYSPDTEENRHLAEEELRRRRIQFGLGELKKDIGGGIEAADFAARGVFDAVDNVDAAVAFVKRPCWQSAAALAVVILTVGITASAASRNFDDAPSRQRPNGDLSEGSEYIGPDADSPIPRPKVEGAPNTPKPRPTGAKGLIGTAFEEWLLKNLGGTGSFSKSGRQFDGAITPNRWYEAKSGRFWEFRGDPTSGFQKFKSDIGAHKKIAIDNCATLEVYSNTPIPQYIKDWLTAYGVQFFELLD